MIVVNDFPALYHAERRAHRLIQPPEGLGQPDGNGVRAVAAGKGVSLRRGDADFPVPCKIHGFVSGRAFGNMVLSAP